MTEDQSTASLGELLLPYARRFETLLESSLPEPGTPAELGEAMSYCASGGKRLRPALVMMSAEACGGSFDAALTGRAAVAIELVHCYSLVHDDLPAMDDDSLRRGQPTAHVQYGEAMAILAGDALLTRALGLLAGEPSPRSAMLVAELASAAGPAGMIAGQVADMDLCTLPPGEQGLEYIPLRKTAALIRCGARMGAISAGADEAAVEALGRFGEDMGMAFQLVDDLLDEIGEADEIGKTPGKDAAAGKKTHLAALGAEAVREMIRWRTDRAIEALTPLGRRNVKLCELARLLCERRF